MPETTASHRPTPPQSLPMQTREASIVPQSYNEAEGTIEVTWTTGARGIRYDWWKDEQYEEELVVIPEAVDMTRFEAGTVQALDSHSTYSLSTVLGRATRGWIADGMGHAAVKLSVDPEKAGRVADIKAGVIRSISVGYTVQRYEVIEPADRTDGRPMKLVRATRWTPHEISFVNVPFDTGSVTRSADQRPEYPVQILTRSATAGRNPQEQSMPQVNAGGDTNANAIPNNDAVIAAERTRSATILQLCALAGKQSRAAEFIASDLAPEAVGAKLQDELAAADRAAGGHVNVNRNIGNGSLPGEYEIRVRGIEEALLHRLDPRAKMTEAGAHFRGMDLTSIGREYLALVGINTRGMDRYALAGHILRARSTHMDQYAATRSGAGYMGTSDFGFLMSSVTNRRLRSAYEVVAPTYKLWARRAADAPDFRNINVGQISSGPELSELGESGEFTYGTYRDSALSYKVATGGKIVALTRQVIINDDLRAMDSVITNFGSAAGRRENRLVYAQLTTAQLMSDGKELFAAEHANSDASAPLTIDALKAGRKRMRKQVGFAGNSEPAEALNIGPRYLICPSDLESEGAILTSANYAPARREDTNEFASGQRSALTMVVDPILDAAPSTWFLAADSSTIDTVEYAFLEGAEGPVIEMENGFEVDGLQIRCRHDFAARVIDWRGLYRGVGA